MRDFPVSLQIFESVREGRAFFGNWVCRSGPNGAGCQRVPHRYAGERPTTTGRGDGSALRSRERTVY
jgi:hypothetical protein